MNVERPGSIVKDLREALQDVVAPDLKAVVRGLSDLKEQMQTNNTLMREELAAVDRRTAERIEASETRTAERLARIYDAVKIADLTRRNEELERELAQAREHKQVQQH